MNTLARFINALRHRGPGYDLPPAPRRGDTFDHWLRDQRDRFEDNYGHAPAWYAVDAVLDAYRLHADTGTPLTEHVCEGRMVGDCDCLEVAA